MAHLRLTGVSDDGRHLRLEDEAGVEHLLAIDERLRAAVRGTTPSGTTDSGTGSGTGGATGSSRGMEKTMESTLRPRDIQARIRAGETPEAVAQAAQTSVEKIMAVAAPVLAEREHVAERAQRSSLRRAGDGARTLGDAVAAHLRSLNVDPGTVAWDAWRREDGRWTLTAEYAGGERNGTARLTFDAPGNYVTLDNDDARWLVGEQPATPPPPVRADDLQVARERRAGVRTSSVDDTLPLGESLGSDAIDLVSEQPLEAFLDDRPPHDEQVAAQQAELRTEAADAAAAHEAEVQPEVVTPVEQAEPAADEPPARKPSRKNRRASVPSWDEIMFGSGDKG